MRGFSSASFIVIVSFCPFSLCLQPTGRKDPLPPFLCACGFCMSLPLASLLSLLSSPLTLPRVIVVVPFPFPSPVLPPSALFSVRAGEHLPESATAEVGRDTAHRLVSGPRRGRGAADSLFLSLTFGGVLPNPPPLQRAQENTILQSMLVLQSTYLTSCCRHSLADASLTEAVE